MDHRFWMLRFRLFSISFPLFLIASVHFVEAQEAIFIVRHAEQSLEVTDPPLTEVGQRRATALVTLLKETGIDAIYESEIRRTQETAEPLGKALDIQIQTYLRQDIKGFIDRLRTQHAQDRVLIISQSLRIPHWLKALGYPVDVTIAPKEYDNLFVVIPRGGSGPLLFRLHY